MKLWETFRYEVVYQVRNVSIWVFFLFLLIITYLLASEVFIDEPVVGGYSLFAPYYIAKVSVIAYIVGILILAPIPGNAATRDIETRMYPLLYTAPISKFVYLGGRFLAALTLGAILMTAIPAGILGASLFPGEHVLLTAPIIPAAYLNAYFLFVLPNTFVAMAFMFAVATLSRRGIASFLVAILIFFIAFASWQLIAVNEGNWKLAKLTDPLGISLIQELKTLWSPVEKNTLMAGTQTWTLLNRLIWCLIALSLLVLTYLRFRREPTAISNKMGKGGRFSKFPTTPEGFHILKDTPIVVPQVQQTFGFSSRALQVITVSIESFKVVMGWGWIAFTCLAIFVFLTSPSWFSDFHHASQLPVSGHLLILLENHTYNAIWFVIPLLILYYAGELVWREREARLHEIIGAAPIPIWISFAGKFTGLFLALVLMQVLMMISGMMVQMRLGYYDFEFPLYLKILFGIRLVDYTLLGLLAFVIHVVVNQKYIGNLIIILFFVIAFYGYLIGIEPGLFVYGSDPGWTYSEIRGLEPYMYPWFVFKLYWVAWALLLAVVANLLWPRGTERTLKQRIQEGSRRLTRQTKAITAFAVMLILIFGGFIFYNTSILHPRTAAPEGEEWKADYEKLYRKYADSPQPWLTAVNLHVEIFPELRAVDIRGRQSYVNRTGSRIDSIHLATALGVENHLIRFSRTSTPKLIDEKLGHHIYVLDKPLLPGDSLHLDFHVSFSPQGFPNYGIDASLVKNGSSVDDAWLPKMGYQKSREIEDPKERSKQGLNPNRMFLPSLDVARMGIPGQERIDFEAVVGTDKEQIAIAPGKLQRSWSENGRSYFHYSTEAPIINDIAFFSADYDVSESQWKSKETGQLVDIEILYHPGHTLNLERMVNGIHASLDYLTKQLGPYPHSEIRFLENTGYNKGMQANPTNVWYRTGYALLNQASDSERVDVTFATVAHEVAHQWWGHQLSPAIMKGNILLIESLAWYSAFEIIEEALGKEKFLDLVHQFQQEYFSPQARSVQPLLKANDHTLIYRKGPLVLYTIREYVGKEQVRMALKNLFKKNAFGSPPLPTPQDLFSELQKVTPDSMHYLLHDLLATNTYWDLKTEQSSASQTKEGSWQVSLDVQARKYTVDTLGVETDVPMDDWIQIGIFDAGEGQKGEREALYLKWHRISSGKQTIKVNLPNKPAYAGIDPSNLLMDLKRGNNTSKVALQQQE
ncbi:ABC transporter permease/M1 family aminopeptidase [Pontibacter cellulosilyticus]|uniref:ABC transporter permease n=1 Tax=Pontibacter cellulosilyticus TaxID=1720253 RepID=A0A923N4S9_9BACT|nr:M1 family aminopeptidase [Pontibacter cellulosilyticus]MBC5991859.1 ABC transporter permease [Pontibacter cellulosilyticus]